MMSMHEFREMRRKNQALSLEECEAILYARSSGILAVAGDNDYPYTVPLSYIYHDGKIFFHSARTGHKLDAISRNDKVSFCVIDQDHVMPQEYTTYFRSIVVFGRVRVLEDEREKREVFEKLIAKYSPNYVQGGLQEVDKFFPHVCMSELAIERMTGKEAIELVRMRDEKES